MKRTTQFPFFILFVSLCLSVNAQRSKPFTSDNVFQTDCFIENKGQFNAILNDSLSTIDFAVNHGNDEIYFNKNGFKYHMLQATPYKETAKERKEEKDKHEEQENHIKYDVEEDWFELQWLGFNMQAIKQQFKKTNHYFTYGSETYNSYGYKEIGYSNIYPGIDIKYELHERGGIKYSFILHPYADINIIRFKYHSPKGLRIWNENNRLVISNKVGKIIECDMKAYYSDGQEVQLAYALDAGQIISFKPLQEIDKSRGLIIDPWVIADTSLTGTAICSYMAYDVDYDFSGNLIAIGGGGGSGATSTSLDLPKLAKYDSLGNLLWTFSGYNVSPIWSSSPIWSGTSLNSVGNFVVDKRSNKIYMSQGLSITGASAIRLSANGNFDNFISTPDSIFREFWEIKFDCNNGKLLGMGGGTPSDQSIGMIDTTTALVTHSNVTGVFSSWGQDIVCAAIDANGEVYTIISSYTTPSVNNKIYKLNANYTSNLWSSSSGFNSFFEGGNKPYTGMVFFSNGFNALSVNNQYLFYYDGVNIKAFDKSTGAAVGASLTISGHSLKYQGGIYANDCNEVFVGGNDGNIVKFLFNGTSYSAIDTLYINGYTGISVYDIVYNPMNNLIYASGNGFVATVDPQSICPITGSSGNTQLGLSKQCPDSAFVTILNPDTNLTYAIIWIDSSANTTLANITLPVGVYSHGLSGLIDGNTIQVSVLRPSACQVLSKDTSFIFSCSVNLKTCPGDSIMLSNGIYISTPGLYTDTFTNVFNQDSVVHINFSNYPTYSTVVYDTLCDDINYVLPNNSIVTSSGVYTSNLFSVNGCDSVVISNVKFSATTYLQQEVTICENKYHLLPDGSIADTAGVYLSTFTNTDGCDSVITTTVKIATLPLVDLGNDTMLCGNMGILLNVSTPNATYLWSDGSNLSYNTFDHSGIYFVAVTTPPCEPVMDSIEILHCPCHVFIPNAYSPNKDSKNDLFKPIVKCLLDLEYFSFQVFNRWGAMVFNTSNPNDSGWDGTFRTVEQEVGVYFYVLKFRNPQNGKMEFYQGDVTLVR